MAHKEIVLQKIMADHHVPLVNYDPGELNREVGALDKIGAYKESDQ